MALNFNLPEDGGQFYVQNIAARQCLHINASRSAKTGKLPSSFLLLFRFWLIYSCSKIFTVPLFATSCNFKGSDRPAGIVSLHWIKMILIFSTMMNLKFEDWPPFILQWQTNLTTPSDTSGLLPRSNDGSQSYKILFLFLGEFMSTPNINSGTGVVAERVATTGSKTKWVVSASRTSIAYK